jgi:hypothetical protein
MIQATIFVRKNQYAVPRGQCPDAEFPGYEPLIRIADRLESHCTVTPLPRQPRDGRRILSAQRRISLTSREALFRQQRKCPPNLWSGLKSKNLLPWLLMFPAMGPMKKRLLMVGLLRLALWYNPEL